MGTLGPLIDLLAKVAVKMLTLVAAYYRGKEEARHEHYEAALEAANRALAWKAEHPIRPPGPIPPPSSGYFDDDFRVRPGAGRIEGLPPDDPRPPEPDRRP